MTSRRGVVLVTVLIATALAGMVAAGLLFRMRALASASAAVDGGEQARMAAMSGIRRAVALLKSYPREMSMWYDDPDLLRSQQLRDDGANVWYFTIYAPDPADPTSVRYGLIDEAGKLNLNIADKDSMLKLPVMTDELVDCLLDYRDEDQITGELGAEQEYYDRLPHPYLIKNGPLTTLEELLLVKGFDASVVYGEDANLNGLMEPNEDDGDETFPLDDGDGRLDTGLRGLATVVTYAPEMDSEGQPRVNVNGETADLIEAGLSGETIQFIEIYRGQGHVFRHPAELLEMRYRLTKDYTLEDGTLILEGDSIESYVGPEELPLVCDRLCKGGGGLKNVKRGLVNINTAPAEVLQCVKGIDSATARAIVQTRASLDDETKSTIAWLYTEGVLNADAFKAVAGNITARSYQFRVQCVGFGVPCGTFRVLEAIVDTASGQPRIIYLRDLTRLGMPIAMDTELLETEQQ